MSARERTTRYWREDESADVAIWLGPNADRFGGVWERARGRAVAGKPGVVWN